LTLGRSRPFSFFVRLLLQHLLSASSPLHSRRCREMRSCLLQPAQSSSARHGSSAQLSLAADRTASRIGHVAGPHLPNFSEGPMGQRPTPLVLCFAFLFSPFLSCVLFAWRRGEKAEGMDAAARPSPVARMAAAGPGRPASRTRGVRGLPGLKSKAPSGHAGIALPRRRPRGGVRRVDAWPPARPRISTAFRRFLFPARVLVRDRCETRLLGFPACKLLLLHFYFLLGGSGHGFHASTGVDPATRQSFLQCLARFQETKLG
jgi:hypothetical protein